MFLSRGLFKLSNFEKALFREGSRDLFGNLGFPAKFRPKPQFRGPQAENRTPVNTRGFPNPNQRLGKASSCFKKPFKNSDDPVKDAPEKSGVPYFVEFPHGVGNFFGTEILPL
jgi:hypothetical protein